MGLLCCKQSPSSDTEKESLVSEGNTKNAPILMQITDFKSDMTKIFYLYAGRSSYGKNQLYMKKDELKTFLDTVNITTPVEEIFKSIDTEVIDNRITVTEFVDYFCNPEINPNCGALQEHIQSQISWQLLKKALRIFEIIDKDRSQCLEENEFKQFAEQVGVTDIEEQRTLWHELDADQSGTIEFDELFQWFRTRLQQQQAMHENQNHE